MKQILTILLVTLSSLLVAQDTTLVSYLSIEGNGQKLLLPVETPVLHDTLFLFESGFEYDTLRKVGFTWVDKFDQVNYNVGYLVEELTLWVPELNGYAQPRKFTSQYFIVYRGQRFLFKNYLADYDEYTEVFLNSKPKHKSWWQKPNRYVLEMYEL